MIDVHHPFFGSSADVELCLCVIRNDIRRIPAFGDNPVNADVTGQLLTKQPYGIENKNHRIKGIDSVMRCGRSMGSFSFKLNPNGGTGNLFMGQLMVIRTRVHTQSRIHILEKSFPHKAPFGAAVFAAFFSGGSVNTHFTSHFVDHLFESRSRQAGGCAEKVVPAGMADAVQCVIFRQKAEHRAGFG